MKIAGAVKKNRSKSRAPALRAPALGCAKGCAKGGAEWRRRRRLRRLTWRPPRALD